MKAGASVYFSHISFFVLFCFEKQICIWWKVFGLDLTIDVRTRFIVCVWSCSGFRYEALKLSRCTSFHWVSQMMIFICVVHEPNIYISFTNNLYMQPPSIDHLVFWNTKRHNSDTKKENIGLLMFLYFLLKCVLFRMGDIYNLLNFKVI